MNIYVLLTGQREYFWTETDVHWRAFIKVLLNSSLCFEWCSWQSFEKWSMLLSDMFVCICSWPDSKRLRLLVYWSANIMAYVLHPRTTEKTNDNNFICLRSLNITIMQVHQLLNKWTRYSQPATSTDYLEIVCHACTQAHSIETASQLRHTNITLWNTTWR